MQWAIYTVRFVELPQGYEITMFYVTLFLNTEKRAGSASNEVSNQ